MQVLSIFKDSVLHASDGSYFESSVISSNKSKFRKVDFNPEVIPNGEAYAQKLNVMGYPVNMLIDKQGIIRKIYTGAYVDKDANDKKMDEIYVEMVKLKAEKD